MSEKHLALIVDDEPDICELLVLTLTRMDIDSITAGDLKTARKLLAEQQISICLTDMRLPDGNGLELVQLIQQQYSHIPVAMISAHGNMDSAITALKSGAFDFVSKPVVLSELRNLVNAAIKLAEQNKQAKTTSRENRQQTICYRPEGLRQQLLGDSIQMEKIRQLIVKLSKSQAPVLITGRSGTGKELAARYIHQCGPRGNGPFVPVNCGAIPEELMESEFFGHKKGSFTGAIRDKTGLFRAADGGTLFLDEVADLPLNMQVKLLRAIQEKAVKPVGDEKEYKIDVRIISATHKNLKQMVANDQFREDLYYRINVIEMTMPSLCERPQDIEILARHILKRLSPERPLLLTDTALQQLRQYHFPGNIRELENILERAMTLCENDVIDSADLHLPETGTEQHQTLATNKASADNNPASAATDFPDRSQIKEILEQTHWNRKAAAALLGLSYRQLRYRLKKLGLE